MPRRELLLEACEDRILCAASLYPVTAPVFLQTSGESAGAGTGDWYTANETSSTDRAHYLAVEVTAGMLAAGGGAVSITINDADTAPASGNDETRNARDPARFSLLAADRATVIGTPVIVAGTAADGTNAVFNVTTAGIYYVKAETGARPISGDATVGLNDDDNSYTITVSQDGGTVGSYQSSFQQSVAGTREFYFFVGPGTSSLLLRNFDLDGGASGLTYIRPNGTTVAGTVSGATVWNGAGTLNTGGDTISGLTLADAGVWTFRIANWTANNQTSFEANTGAGQRLVLSDSVAASAGRFTLSPSSTNSTNIGVPVDQTFSVTNNYFTNDIINFTLSGTAPNFTVQLLTSTGTALTDSDGDGRLDTGVLTPGQTGNYLLRVTPLAGAGASSTTRISGVSFMDQKVDPVNNTTLFIDKTTAVYSTLSGFVYGDVDNNGVKGAAEAGIAGVSVRITGTDFTGAAVNLTTTTNASGAYTFANLNRSNAAGYTLTELTQPVGFSDGLDSAGSAGGTAGNDVISGIVLNGAVTATNYNFGEIPPTLSVSSPVVTEGTNAFAVFSVSLSIAPATPVSVNLTLTNGTATGADYGPGLEVSTNGGTTWVAATSATIAAGSTNVLVRTPIIDDPLDEAAETFTLTATRSAGTTTNTAAMGTATINDDDPAPTLAINDVTVNEAAGTATSTVTLSAASGRTVTVGYATANVTATAGADYTATSGTLTFAAGETSRTVTVAILNDAVFENSESFNLVLSGPTNATIADGTGVGTILDDGTGAGGTDNDTPALSINSPTVTEGTDGFAIFTVSLSNTSTTPVTVSLALADGTATGGNVDFGGGIEVSTNGGATWTGGSSVTIAAGTTSVLVRTPIVNDSLNELAETFTLTATRTSGTTSNASMTGTATIADNDAAPAFLIDDVTVNEGAGTATFTVSLTTASGSAVQVDYATSNGTALAGVDYAATSGRLLFTPGTLSKTITVSILNDAFFEGAESFNMLLSAPQNATIADATGVATILDDGTGAGGTDDDRPTISVSSPAVTEGAATHAVFTVSLSNTATMSISANLALTAQTAAGGGVDFGPGLEVSTNGGTTWVAAGSTTFAAGTTSVLVRTPIINDTLDEAAETFTLTATPTAALTKNASATGTATITDNDPPPSIAIDDVTVNEGAGTATFTVSLSTASGQAVSVNYATSNGTATAGADYASGSGTVTFAAGVTSQTITVGIFNDATFENSETFNVLLAAAVNATIADGTGVGTILDNGTGAGGTDNDTPSLSVSNLAVTEGTDAFAVFSVNLSNPSTTAVSVALAPANGTATGGGTDFGPTLEVSSNGGATWTTAATATIAAGSTSVLVRTPITNDALSEASENFTLTATRTAGTTTNATTTGTATIADNDAPPSLSIDDVTVDESAGTAAFTVTLSAPSGQFVTVGYATSDGFAVAGSDYASGTGTLSFAAGVTSQTITVSILNDAIGEPTETFNVLLSAPTNATIAAGFGVGTITDNDAPTLLVSNVTTLEGTDPFAVFSVSLSNLSTTPVTVSLALVNGTALGGGTDFGTAGAGNLEISTDGGATWADATSATIAAGSTSVLVRTPITTDSLDENTERFTLTATRTAGTTTNASATGTADILDADIPPTVSISDVTVNEVAGTATFTVSLSAESGQFVTVGYATSSGTATSGADFIAASGTLSFAAGVTSQTITVTIVDDAIFESSEAFNVMLSGATNATIAGGAGVGTILDDGAGTGGVDDDTPTLSVSGAAATEGANPFAVFTVSLSNLSTTAVEVSLALANGTALGGGTDFGPGLEVSNDGGTTWIASSTATIAAGTASVLVRTPVTNDALDEAAETFLLTATRTAGAATNAAATGTGTITDDDATPSLVIDDVTVNEAAGTMTFTVSLSAASGQAVSVDYATSSGTATTGADFTGTSGTLNFASGLTSQTVTVSILDDAIFEQSEAFAVTLSNAANATIADTTGVGTILDDGTGAGGTDDDTPTLAITDINATEGTDGFAVFMVSLSNVSTTPVDLALALADGTAVGGGTDFGTGGAGHLQVSTDGGATWNDAASATIAAGSTSVLVRTPITDDGLSEAVEDFTLTATRTAGTTTNASVTGTTTIADNDGAPTISINDVTVNEAAGTMIFTVTLSAPSGQIVTVDYGTGDGTAAAGADFTGTSGTLTFLPLSTSQTVTVSILDDAIFENSENFSVLLSNAVNATIADTTGAGTILDDGTGAGGTDNDTPTLSIGSPTVTEGADAFAEFTVSLSNASTTPVTVNLALANGTATGGGTDFGPAMDVSKDGGLTWSAATGATIAAGSTSVQVRTPINDDALDEAVENFTLTAMRTAGTTSNASVTGTATINDNDATPSLSIDDVTVNEAAGTATFTVSLSAASGLPVSVNYATGSGTATTGADFTGTSGTLNFASGVTSQTLTVAILDDAIFENSEAFNVTLSGEVNATIADGAGVGTILDDGTGAGGADDDTPALSVSSAAATEGVDGFAVFTVSLSNESATPVDVSLVLTVGTATGADYGPVLEVSTDGGTTWIASSSATIAAGSTSVLVRTPVADDTLDEPAENFTLTATRTSGTTSNASAAGTGTIADNDPTPSLVIDDVTVNEGAGTAAFTVTLSAASGRAVSVSYATSDGTATAGADYAAGSGTLSFAPGETTQTVTVGIFNDGTFESSESFNVLLGVATNATIADATGVGTILDDGTGAGGTDNDTPALSVSNTTVSEGVGSFALFTVSLSNPSTTAVSVSLALASGTATGAGTDFGTVGAGNLQVSTDGGATWSDATSATIAAGTTSILARTPITDDTLDEASESFSLTATRTAGTTTNAAATGTAAIDDNDAPPSLGIDDVTVNEGAGTMTFTVNLSAASGLLVMVNYVTSDGTATAGSDYSGAAGALSFAAGVISQTITVPIFDDAIFETSESFTVMLSGATNATVADGAGVGRILDDGTGAGGTDNDTPSFSISSTTATEGTDGFAMFTVSLSNVSTTPVSVALALADATAVGGGTDFGTAGAGNLQVSTDGGATWADATSATIAAGSSSVLVRTPITDDALDETPETFTLTATRTAGATTNTTETGTATIVDNDGPPALSINDVTVNEGAGTATFTVTLDAASALAISVDYTMSNGTAGAGDYTPGAGTLNFAAGVTTQTITVAILDDAVFENSESFTVLLSGAVNATIADATGLGTILDDGTGAGGMDDDRPTLSVSSVTVTEGTDPFAQFTVTLSNPATAAIDVDLVLLPGTALGGGVDYGTSGAGNLQVSTDDGATWVDAISATFAPGMTNLLVRTPIILDQIAEVEETFELQATVTSAPIINAGAQGTATIKNTLVVPVVSEPAKVVVSERGTPPAPFVFAFDSFRNFSSDDFRPDRLPPSPFLPKLRPIDVSSPAMLPLAPIYSGEADPGATLIIELYNAHGVRIGSQTVMADAGGNWLASFGSTAMRDTPSDVRIRQVNAPHTFGHPAGNNLRTYYAPSALNPAHFLSQGTDSIMDDDDPAPLLGGLDLANPLQLGPVKYGGEFLPSEGVASGQ